MFGYTCKLQLSGIEGFSSRLTAWSSGTSSEYIIPGDVRKNVAYQHDYHFWH
jgi:hypothetical protein